MSPHQEAKTTVVHLKRRDGKVVQDCDVYIGRAVNMGGWRLRQSDWFNPFSAKEFGRDQCIAKYKAYLLGRDDLIKRLHELKGKRLGCWCKPDACHGDVLVELVEALGV